MKTSKWTKSEIDRLIKLTTSSTSKSAVFSRLAREMGLKPNSVRNFYYKLISNTEKKVFSKFTKLDIESFLRTVILGYSRGESIRSICLAYANGDRSKMLRYQNKYRSILAKNPKMISQMVRTLENEGYFIKSPVEKPTVKDNIIAMPVPATNYNELSDQDITNLFMGVVRLVRKQSQSQVEKLKSEIERLKAKSRQQSSVH